MDMENASTQPVAIVSGGSGYLGSAIVKCLEARGWQVAALGRTHRGNASHACDITNERDVATAIAGILKTYGRIDACIHAAAAPTLPTPKKLLDLEVAEYTDHLAVAAHGAFLLAKYAAPHLPQDGTFIGITSALIEAGATPPPLGPYLPSKYALRGFLRALASEARAIRVYAVAPGYMRGGLNKDLPDAALALFARKTGAGETSAEEVAEKVAAMCLGEDTPQSGVSITIPGDTTHPL